MTTAIELAILLIVTIILILMCVFIYYVLKLKNYIEKELVNNAIEQFGEDIGTRIKTFFRK
jgi:Na+/glutamate symporter